MRVSAGGDYYINKRSQCAKCLPGMEISAVQDAFAGHIPYCSFPQLRIAVSPSCLGWRITMMNIDHER
jgi:hypothetical protein